MTRPARNILHFQRRKPRVMVGCHYDHDQAHYSFLRQHTDDAPEPIAPLRPYLKDIRDGTICFVVIAIIIYITHL